MKNVHITLVGKEALPVFYPIYEYHPDIIYLIGTKESRVAMANLCATIKQMGMKCVQEKLKDAYDANESRRKCDSIIADEGFDCTYTFNLTGGAKPMALGAMWSAILHNCEMIYTESKNYINIRTSEKTPLQKHLPSELIFMLQGQKLKSYNQYTPDPERSKCAEEVRNQVFDPYKREVLDLLKAEYDRNINHINSPFSCGPVSYKKDGTNTIIAYNDDEIFQSDYPEADMLLFEGRWWETLVADAIYKWAKDKYDVWTSVVFDPQKEDYTRDGIKITKNEIDILVNLGNKFLFVECKSNSFNQDDIYKLNRVTQTYGSDKSKGVLIAYRIFSRIRSNLREKATDNKVDILTFDNDFSNLDSELTRVINTLKA